MNSTTIYNVTQINNKIAYLFDRELSNIFIKGEISSFTIYDSGHAYFTLKDDKNLINCVYFNRKKSGPPNIQENIEIVAYGNINVYKPRGRMQFIVSSFHIGDEGLLWKNYLDLLEWEKNLPKIFWMQFMKLNQRLCHVLSTL